MDEAHQEVRVLAYSFTSKPIADSLIRARLRGIDVRVIVDSKQPAAKGNQTTRLINGKVSVKVDAEHRIAHNKVVIIDQTVVMTGSFNFSRAAERDNAENLLTIHDAALASEYLTDWQKHDQHSK